MSRLEDERGVEYALKKDVGDRCDDTPSPSRSAAVDGISRSHSNSETEAETERERRRDGGATGAHSSGRATPEEDVDMETPDHARPPSDAEGVRAEDARRGGPADRESDRDVRRDDRESRDPREREAVGHRERAEGEDDDDAADFPSTSLLIRKLKYSTPPHAVRAFFEQIGE